MPKRNAQQKAKADRLKKKEEKAIRKKLEVLAKYREDLEAASTEEEREIIASKIKKLEGKLVRKTEESKIITASANNAQFAPSASPEDNRNKTVVVENDKQNERVASSSIEESYVAIPGIEEGYEMVSLDDEGDDFEKISVPENEESSKKEDNFEKVAEILDGEDYVLVAPSPSATPAPNYLPREKSDSQNNQAQAAPVVLSENGMEVTASAASPTTTPIPIPQPNRTNQTVKVVRKFSSPIAFLAYLDEQQKDSSDNSQLGNTSGAVENTTTPALGRLGDSAIASENTTNSGRESADADVLLGEWDMFGLGEAFEA